jgi:hypothetical protein
MSAKPRPENEKETHPLARGETREIPRHHRIEDLAAPKRLRDLAKAVAKFVVEQGALRRSTEQI